jgi:hypothetical protein
MLEPKEVNQKKDSVTVTGSDRPQANTFRLTPRIPIQPVLLITRPLTITICSVVLFFSAAITLILVLQNSTYLTGLRHAFPPVVIYLGIGYTALVGYGYWRMKRWAVLLCGFDVLVRFASGMPNSWIAIPALVAAFGIISFDEMTWK